MVLMSISLSTRSILMSSISNSYNRKGREEIFSSLFFKMMGDKYYLVFSWNNVVYYRVSDNFFGPWEKEEIDTFDGDGFYAAVGADWEIELTDALEYIMIYRK